MKNKQAMALVLLASIAQLDVIGSSSALAQVEEDPSGIIAAHIRQQGYPCDNPQGATRDEAASQPNETVWMLDCGNTNYRVTLVPDMAAQVETLAGGKEQPASSE